MYLYDLVEPWLEPWQIRKVLVELGIDREILQRPFNQRSRLGFAQRKLKPYRPTPKKWPRWPD